MWLIALSYAAHAARGAIRFTFRVASLEMIMKKYIFAPLAACLFGFGTSILAEQTAMDDIVFGMGCFWGAEKHMSELPGVLDVESGFAGGDAARVGYQEVLAAEKKSRADTRQRNHAEVVRVRFDPARVSLEDVLIHFWENHDPTQGNRQGNDIGSNYRSAVYYKNAAQKEAAERTRDIYQKALTAAKYPAITTEILPLKNYNRAEENHQDYLLKNPAGYCGLGGTGVAYPGTRAGTPLFRSDTQSGGK